MARDYEELYDLVDMDDDELHELVVSKLREYPEIDADFLEITVAEGVVTIEGRVGTEEEVQELDQILGDGLGLREVENNVVVDATVRAEYSEDPVEAAAQDAEVEDELGEGGKRTDPSADHLMPDAEGEMYGTHDMQKAIERGESYSPPDRPPQMGSRSRENH